MMRPERNKGASNPATNAPDIVYTAIVGGYDVLMPPVGGAEGTRYVVLGDRRPRFTFGWEFRTLPAAAAELPAPLANRWCKFFAHRLFPKARNSVYVDGNIRPTGPLVDIVGDLITSGAGIGLFRHPHHDTIEDEIAACVMYRRLDAEGADAAMTQLERYRAAGLPEDYALTENNILVRDHAHPALEKAMALWWEEVTTGVARDQISLPWVRHTSGLDTVLWDWTPRMPNPHFRLRQNHRRPGTLLKDVVHFVNESRGLSASVSGAGHLLDKARAVRTRFRRVTTKRISAPHLASAAPVVFLHAPSKANSGNAVMRCHQLGNMIAEAMPARSVSICDDDTVPRGAIVILNKSYLTSVPPEALDRLVARGNLLVCDHVDLRVLPQHVARTHAIIACSHTALAHYRRNFPRIPSFHVTHHVDPRLRPGNDAKGLSLGYIGEPTQAMWSYCIRRRVGIVHVDTSRQSIDWLSKARDFNMHYAMRFRKPSEGYKPFLKGFVSAWCDSNMIVGRDVEDAEHYLGSDYPFLLGHRPTEDMILAMIDRAATVHGGPLWREGLERMARVRQLSSRDHVISEFRSMLEAL